MTDRFFRGWASIGDRIVRVVGIQENGDLIVLDPSSSYRCVDFGVAVQVLGCQPGDHVSWNSNAVLLTPEEAAQAGLTETGSL
jgi:hypothetical protein